MSGMNFPLNQLFNSVQALTTLVSALIPVGLGLDALRQLLFPGKIEGVLPWGRELGALAIMGVVFVTAAYLMLKRMEWLAKVEARLSLRWQ
jgi:hypothetical protein